MLFIQMAEMLICKRDEKVRAVLVRAVVCHRKKTLFIEFFGSWFIFKKLVTKNRPVLLSLNLCDEVLLHRINQPSIQLFQETKPQKVEARFRTSLIEEVDYKVS